MSSGEEQYLSLLQKILHEGERRPTRNAVTYSLFGAHLKFDLNAEGFPLLTTKKMYWKGVVKELLWFLKGETDAKKLSGEGVRIWNGNSTREFLDARGLQHYMEGDCGPIYGFQWRHFRLWI
tara:strand:- start:23733 stop:24098 length:366 start_codon:yes stop_codon:yes gene_type:complete